MKKFKIILVWSLFCILIECLVLFYLDKIAFKHSSDFTVKQVSSEEDIKDEYEVDIPDEASSIQASFNGRYISYFENESFYVVDTKSLDKKEVFTDEDDKNVLFAKWLPDRNLLVVAVKEKNKNGNVISLKNYDAKAEENKSIKEICTYENGMNVDDIATTTLSGVSYVGISRKNDTSLIYRIDINEDMKKVTTKANKVGSMGIFPHEDTLVYEDKKTNRYYSYSNGATKRIDLSNYGNVALLAMDNSGNVYMGQINNDEINNIVYGKYNESTSSWKNRTLKSAKREKDIFINSDKQLLINDEDKICNLDTGKETEYVGELLEIKDNVICSRKDNKVYLKKYNF